MYDVIVIGGGASGVCFTNEAERLGAKALLVEQSNHLGGLSSTKTVEIPVSKYSSRYPTPTIPFPFDLHGGHVFNAKDKDVRDWVFSKLPRSEWHEHQRTSRALLSDEEGKSEFVAYPVERSTYPWNEQSPFGTFPAEKAGVYGNYLKTEYGPVAEKYLLHYDHKLWGNALTELRGDHRPPTMPRSALGVQDGSHTHEVFYYPKSGGYQSLFAGIKVSDFILNAAASTVWSYRAGEAGDRYVVIVGGHRYEARHVVYTGNLESLKSLLGFPLDLNFQLRAFPLTCILTTDYKLCHLAEGTSWLYLPGTKYKHDILNYCHKIDNVGLFNDRDGEAVCLVSTKLGVPYAPGEVTRSEIRAAYPFQGIHDDVQRIKAKLAESDFYLLGRMAEWKHATIDYCIGEALKLARRLYAR